MESKTWKLKLTSRKNIARYRTSTLSLISSTKRSNLFRKELIFKWQKNAIQINLLHILKVSFVSSINKAATESIVRSLDIFLSPCHCCYYQINFRCMIANPSVNYQQTWCFSFSWKVISWWKSGFKAPWTSSSLFKGSQPMISLKLLN